MNKYILDIRESEKNHAGPKAKEDISLILKNEDFKRITIDSDVSKLSKYLFYPMMFKYKLKDLVENDILIVQHPMNLGKELEQILLNIIVKQKVKLIYVIHDLNSLRNENRRTVDEEIKFLNYSHYVVSHNISMTKFLIDNGLKSKIVELKIFDYLSFGYESNRIKIENDFKKIVFAGNLVKSEFLKEMNIKSKILLYGKKPDFINSGSNYMGSYNSTKIITQLESGFGLVWDGNSLNTCSGVMGEYMRYNNPHKVSLYLASGIPVIIWQEAALSKFIVENNLGFAIGSLNDIDLILNNIDREKMNVILNNVNLVSNKIREGFYIKSAINSILSEIYDANKL